MKFYAVATDFETGKAEYHLLEDEEDNKNDIKWLQASASMPFVSKPVEIKERKYLDGGIADPIPVNFAEELGLDKIIVVRPHPEEYLKKPQKGIPLAKMFYKDNPEFVEALSKHYQIYNDEVKKIEELKKEGKVMVLAPDDVIPANVAERSPEKLLQAYFLGRELAQKRLEDIKEFIAQSEKDKLAK